MTYNAVHKLKKMLIIGLVASVITVLGGELPIGWVVYPESDHYIQSLLLSCRDLSLLQLGCGMLFGGLFIPLHYYGFEAIAQIVQQDGNKRAGRLIHWGGLACAFWGGIVHVICVAMMFLCRVAEFQTVMDFALWLVMPVSLVFMPIYYAMTIAMFVVIVRGRTTFPKWAAVFNPLTASVILNVLPMIAPNTPLVNGLSMANMGVGSVLTFAGFLMLLGRDRSVRGK